MGSTERSEPAMGSTERIDLLIVGAGPTGIATGAEARKAGLSTLLVDRGPLVASLIGFPVDMVFFTTRERLEIAGVPFALPDEKPNRRQAIAYYQAVAAAFALPLALHEGVTAVAAEPGGFLVRGRRGTTVTERRARAVAMATGYFDHPLRLGVAGADLPWVRCRYREPWEHFGRAVVVVGGGNSGAEAALDLFRHGARVTIVHRGAALKPTVKYWLKPDLENRIAEGSIAARFATEVVRFEPGGVVVHGPGGEEKLAADDAYVLIGYEPDMRLLAGAGVEIDPATLVPALDPETCESNVPGLYVAGTLQAGRDTHRIFIENSRDHGRRIVRHLGARLRADREARAAAYR